jgi:hypothetical protein
MGKDRGLAEKRLERLEKEVEKTKTTLKTFEENR